MSGVFRKLSLQVRPGRSGGDNSPPSHSRDSSPASGGKHEGTSRSSTGSTSKHAESVARNSEQIDHVDSTKRTGTSKSELVSKPRSLVGKFHLPGRSPTRASVDNPKNREGEDMSKNQARKHEKLVEKEEKAQAHQRQIAELHKRREEQKKEAESTDPPELRAKYGWAPVNNYSGPW